MIEDLLSEKKTFRDLVVSRLYSTELDFVEQTEFILENNRKGEGWSASGVLVLLEFNPGRQEYDLVLNKRSPFVPQPGDLCCPGGRTGSSIDKILGYLLSKTLIPLLWSSRFKGSQGRTKSERRILAMILAAVLRESWEEMRLPPWQVEYLGGLRTYRLQSFPNIIFPVAGRVRGKWRARPNWEVEKVLRVPVRSFLNPGNYALYSAHIPASQKDMTGLEWIELPCLVLNFEGEEEILWGATFEIIMDFLQRLIDLPPDIIRPARLIERDLPADYFTGRSRD